MFFNQYPYINETDLNLDWILKHMKEVLATVEKLDKWTAEHEKEYLELKKLVDDIYDGNLTPALIKSLNEWFKANITDLIGQAIKGVFFEITDAGYFIAYIPESWEEITFNTTEYDYTTPLQPQFGHLVLSY